MSLFCSYSIIEALIQYTTGSIWPFREQMRHPSSGKAHYPKSPTKT
ncbi:MAG: hypothetical protein IPI63_06205 [Methanothrix sp.]|nr:hypothetical protein [Methanothrix sp.]MBK7386328.1 hypothetical protein [Methanothrix sp.]HPW73647.1 hypothetical protein [Methanothrix sp.]